MQKLPVNPVGLGLLLVGVLLILFMGIAGIYIGTFCVLAGIVALFMTYRRRKAASS